MTGTSSRGESLSLVRKLAHLFHLSPSGPSRTLSPLSLCMCVCWACVARIMISGDGLVLRPQRLSKSSSASILVLASKELVVTSSLNGFLLNNGVDQNGWCCMNKKEKLSFF